MSDWKEFLEEYATEERIYLPNNKSESLGYSSIDYQDLVKFFLGEVKRLEKEWVVLTNKINLAKSNMEREEYYVKSVKLEGCLELLKELIKEF